MAITNLVSVRLTKKLAAKLNGIDVSAIRVGDIIQLPASAAQMLISEGWAELATIPPVFETSSPSRFAH